MHLVWEVTFLVALSGSGLELSQGSLCPATSFQLPLCYVSLAVRLATMAIYWLNRRGRDTCLPLVTFWQT